MKITELILIPKISVLYKRLLVGVLCSLAPVFWTSAASITPGQTIATNLTAAGELDSYTFSGSEGDRAFVRMSWGGGNLFPSVSLLSPEGTIILKRAGRPAAIELVRLPVSGTYTILCEDENGANTGDYGIFLFLHPGPNTGVLTLPVGGSRSGSITLGNVDIYSFEALAGSNGRIRMSWGGGNLFPLVQLIAPNGERIAMRSGRPADTGIVLLPESGTYFVLCSDDGGDIGDYGVSLTLIPPSDDTDEDGLSDAWERKYFGDLRYGPEDDPDEDRLGNEQEEMVKGEEPLPELNPNDKDTDKDGFGDGTEVGAGSNPLDASSIPDFRLSAVVSQISLELNTRTGRQYQIQAAGEGLSWTNLGEVINGNGELFQTNIVVSGTLFSIFRALDVTPGQ